MKQRAASAIGPGLRPDGRIGGGREREPDKGAATIYGRRVDKRAPEGDVGRVPRPKRQKALGRQDEAQSGARPSGRAIASPPVMAVTSASAGSRPC